MRGAILLVGLIVVGVILGIMAFNFIDSYIQDSEEAA